MNKPVYLGLTLLEISEMEMYELWYDYGKPKYRRRQNYVILRQKAL